MKVTSRVNATFKCSLERAFKTPILGDATKFFPRYILLPHLAGFEDDETWGREGGSRVPVISGALFTAKKRAFDDVILKREENKYWKWRLSDFSITLVFFLIKAEGELFFEDKMNGSIQITWIYTFFSKDKFMHPLAWLLAKIFWIAVQRPAIKKMRYLAESGAPDVYN